MEEQTLCCPEQEDEDGEWLGWFVKQLQLVVISPSGAVLRLHF
jgi:hypothetical protein